MESRQSSMTTTVGDKKEGGRDRLHIARRLVVVMWRQVLVHRDVPKVGRDWVVQKNFVSKPGGTCGDYPALLQCAGKRRCTVNRRARRETKRDATYIG